MENFHELLRLKNGKKITFNSANENTIVLYINPALLEISEVIYYFSQNKNQTLKPEISYFNKKVIIQEINNDDGFIKDFQNE